MENIPDDPIIRSIENTGYPPYMEDEEYEEELHDDL